METVAQLCEERPNSNLMKLFPDSYADDSMFGIMRDVEPEFNETFVLCKLFDRWIDCGAIFSRTLTEHGFCRSFNRISWGEYATDE